MFLGSVLGPVESTIKHPDYEGKPLLLIHPDDVGAVPGGLAPVLAIDLVSAGEGDRVLVTVEGAAAIDALGGKNTPVDALIIGIVDQVEVSDGQ